MKTKQITQSTILSRRISKYLLKKNETDDPWVSKLKVISLAKAQNYEYEVIKDAIEEVINQVYTGTWSVMCDDRYANRPHGTYLRCYPMDEATRKSREEWLRGADPLVGDEEW